MFVKKAFAYQLGRAGIEYKINKLRGEYILFNGRNTVVTTEILGPDS
jgi:hypothetical protein